MENNTWKKGIVFGIIVLFVGVSVVPSTGMMGKSTIGRTILYVGGSGPGNYTTIQAAINDANPGDTVYVYNDTYYENVVIDKTINLIGEDKNCTIIDANGGLNAVTINTCSNVLIEGFTVRNASGIHPDGNGIKIYSNGDCNYNTILDCIAYANSNDGVLISVQHNMNAKYNKIDNCELYNNGFDGFAMDAYASPFNLDDNQIWNSKCYNNSRWGILTGGVTYGTNHIISDCETYYNGVGGIYINSYESQILNTSSYQNDGYGMCLMTADNGLITNCTFYNNTNEGINSSYTTPNNNFIYRNTFINNNPNAYDTNNEIWYNATLQEGNYWSDYTGEDNDGDGIGDTPYNIPGGSNQDLYPLMYPWYPTHPDTIYVDDDYDNSTPGWGYDRFNRIQYGINEVEGSTVYVYNGTYNENVDITKDEIQLLGENKNSTVINGDGIGIGGPEEGIISIHNNNISLLNFTIINAEEHGLFINGDYNIISEFVISNSNYGGVYYNDDASYNVLIDSEICNNAHNGVNIASFFSPLSHTEFNEFINLTIHSNGHNGITTYGDYTKGNNKFIGCEIYSNLYHGLHIVKSDFNEFSDCIIYDSTLDGIYIDDNSEYNIFNDSKIFNNEHNGVNIAAYHSSFPHTDFNEFNNLTIHSNGHNGITFSGDYNKENNKVIYCNIFNNAYDGIRLNGDNNQIIKTSCYNNIEHGIGIYEISTNNRLFHNNIFNNTINSYDEGSNNWDNGYPSGGNHWDDYVGDDLYNGPNQDILGRDGIGDTPYNISGGDNQDLYPCMEPNGWINSPPNVPDRPSGEVIVLPGVAYTYTTSTIDSDDDSIWYKWDWGDGTFSDWLGPYDSEEEASESHIWSQGTYEVRVKAKDSRNPETDWSEPLPVNAIFPNLKTVLLFGFITNLSISTDYNSFNVVKLLWIGFNPIFPEILSSNEVIVISDKFFGRLRESFIFGFFNAMVLT